jgi:hypothetical protein
LDQRGIVFHEFLKAAKARRKTIIGEIQDRKLLKSEQFQGGFEASIGSSL